MNFDLKKLNSIIWHDGNFDFFRFSSKNKITQAILGVSLHKDEKVPNRHSLEIKFIDVLYWNSSFDVKELLDYRYSGEISNALVKFCKSERKLGILTFRMCLADGIIEIKAKDIQVKKKRLSHNQALTNSIARAPGKDSQRIDLLRSYYWLNGTLENIAFSLEDKTCISFSTSLFLDYHAMIDKSKKRKFYDFKFLDVLSWQFSCDMVEFMEAKPSGNISNGYFKISKNERKKGILTLRLYLCFGYIEINFKEVQIREKGGKVIAV